MALPTAQLGQMASLNVPSYVPTTVVNKEPKAWEKALLGLLTNVASGVAAKGTENVMTGDSAAEFGQTPNTGFSKFWNGPAIGDKEAAQRRQLTVDQERNNAEAESRHNQFQLANVRETGDRAGRMQSQAYENERLAESGAHNRADEELAAANLTQTGLHQHLQDLVAQIDAQRRGSYYEGETKLGQDRLAQERARQALIDAREAPDRAAQAREYNARAQKEENFAKISQRELDNPVGGKGKPNAKVQTDFTPVSPELQRSRAAIEQRLQTPQYPTAEQIMSRPQTAQPIPQQPQTSNAMPPEVEQAATIIANNPWSRDLDSYRAVVGSWLDNNGQGQTYSPEVLMLRRLIAK